MIARAVAHEASVHFIHINGPEIIDKFYGASEAQLRKVFEEAERKAPSIIFIDEIDVIAAKREEMGGERQSVERRVVAQLLALMDGLQARGQVVVIAATNIPNSLDPALRRPGRFDREIEIGIPDKEGRRQALEIHSRGMPLAEEVDLDRLAAITHGFVGADLAALCREAAMSALRRLMPDIDFKTTAIPYDKLAALKVEWADFDTALADVEPSALREVAIESSDVRWADVGGADEIKKLLTQVVLWQLKYDVLFRQAGVRAPKGVLLHGVPGTGKTLLAKALAGETEANFIAVKGPQLLSRWVGESNAACARYFARRAKPRPASSSSMRSMRWRRAAVAAKIRSPNGWCHNCSPSSTGSRSLRAWSCWQRRTVSIGSIPPFCVRGGWSSMSRSRCPTPPRGAPSCGFKRGACRLARTSILKRWW